MCIRADESKRTKAKDSLRYNFIKMELVLVRHGQTIENVSQIIQGNLDGTLSEAGIKQAKELAKELKKEKFDQIFSSDLGRCVDTAKFIMKYHRKQDLQLTPALRELNFGIHQGKYSRSVDWDSLEGPVLERKFPEGESAVEMSARLIKFINKLLKDFPEQKILLVTHGGPIRVIRSAVENISLEALFDEDKPNVSIWNYKITKPLKVHK